MEENDTTQSGIYLGLFEKINERLRAFINDLALSYNYLQALVGAARGLIDCDAAKGHLRANGRQSQKANRKLAQNKQLHQGLRPQ
jgi:hypothetical protein